MDNREIQFLGRTVQILATEETHLKQILNDIRSEEQILKQEEEEIKRIEKLIHQIKDEYQETQKYFMKLLSARNDPSRADHLMKDLAKNFIIAFKKRILLHDIVGQFERQVQREMTSEREKQGIYAAVRQEGQQVATLESELLSSMIGTDNIYQNISEQDFITKMRQHHKL